MRMLCPKQLFNPYFFGSHTRPRRGKIYIIDTGHQNDDKSQSEEDIDRFPVTLALIGTLDVVVKMHIC